MSEATDAQLTRLALFLAEWSLRWGIVIAVLGIGLALWRPRRAATRLLLCRLVLVGGLILPLLPRCWGPTIVSLPAATPAVEQAQQAPVPLTQQTAPPQSRQMASAAPAVAVTAQADSLSNPAALNVASPAAELKQSTPETARAQGTVGLTTLLVRAGMLVWLAGAMLLMGRLIFGWMCLARLRRSAQPVGAATLDLLRQCRAELSVRRATALL